MTDGGRVGVVIPALDEEQSIGAVVSSLDRRIVSAIVVGDNGSADATADVARAAGATVVSVPERGYGAACAGALAAMPDDVDVIVFVDADGSDDPADLPRLLEPIVSGQADLVIGARIHVEAGALTPQQRIGNAIATALIRRIWGHRYTDLGPFRAVRRDVLERMAMRDRRFGWTVEMQVRALQLGVRVAEVPVAYRKRIGRSKISGTVSGVAKAAFWILFTIAKLGASGSGLPGNSTNGGVPSKITPSKASAH